MVDLKRYHRLHPQGLCRVEKWDNGIVVTFRRFDNETGTELGVEYNYVSVEELEKVREEFTNQLWAVENILEGIKNVS
jgi:hypothetical protein